MKLTQAAKRFDHLVCSDAYTPSVTFKCQIDLYDDSRRDGLTAQRRILSVAPDVVIPSRRCIALGGEYWLVGEGNPDYFMSGIIRVKYIIQRSPHLGVVKTLEEVLHSLPGVVAYVYKSWVKSVKEIEFSSEMPNQYELFFSTTEAVAPGQMVQADGRWYLIRSVHDSAGGLLAAVADELSEPALTTVTMLQRAYQPITDDYATNPLVVPAVRLRWQNHFQYRQQGAEAYKPGDIVLIVPKSQVATVKSGDHIMVGAEKFVLKTFIDGGTTWDMHLQNV